MAASGEEKTKTELATRALEEKALQREAQAFVAWSNAYLKKRDFSCQTLSDFHDGVLLIQLLQQLFNCSLGRFAAQPRMDILKIQNVSTAFDFLKKKGLQLLPAPQQLVDGERKAIIVTLFNVLRLSLMLDVDGSQESSSKQGMKEMLLEWCTASLDAEAMGGEITNFWSRFLDGIAFCHIVAALCPDSGIDLKALNPKNATENLELAFSVAERELGIPRILSVEDLSSLKKPNERAVLNYLAMLLSVSKQMGHSQEAARRAAEAKEAAAAEEAKRLDQVAQLEQTLQEAKAAAAQAAQESKQKQEQLAADFDKALEKSAILEEEKQAMAVLFEERLTAVKSTFDKAEEEAAAQQAAMQAEIESWQHKLEVEKKENEVRQRDLEAAHEQRITALNAELYRLHRDHEEVIQRIARERAGGDGNKDLENKGGRGTGNLDDRSFSTFSLEHAVTAASVSNAELVSNMDIVNGTLMRRRPNARFNAERFKPLHFRLHQGKLEWRKKASDKNPKNFVSLLDYDYAFILEDAEADEVRKSKRESRADEADSKVAAKHARSGSKQIKGTALGAVVTLRLAPKSDSQLQKNVVFEFRVCPADASAELKGLTADEAAKTSLLDIKRRMLSRWRFQINRRIAIQRYIQAVDGDRTVRGCKELFRWAVAEDPAVRRKLRLRDHVSGLFKELEVLRGAIEHHPFLEELLLDNCGIDDSTVTKALKRVLRTAPSLTSVVLSHNRIGEEGASAIAAAVQKNDAVRGLNLDHNHICDAGVTGIAEQVLYPGSNICALSFAGNNITDAGATALATALAADHRMQVETVSLANNSVKDDGVLALFNAAVKNPTLKKLMLSGNGATDVGFSKAVVVLGATALTHVDVSANQIGSKGVQAMVEHLAVIERQVTIDLSHNDLISRPGIQALASDKVALEFAKLAVIKVLVHCMAGVSRSTTVCVAYMLARAGLTMRAALTQVRARRPIVGPNAGFLRQLCALDKEVHGSHSIPPSFIHRC